MNFELKIVGLPEFWTIVFRPNDPDPKKKLNVKEKIVLKLIRHKIQKYIFRDCVNHKKFDANLTEKIPKES